MGLAELLSGNHLLVVGILLIAAAFVMRRSAHRSRATAARDPLRDVQESFARVEQSTTGKIHQAEVRLHDFAREVEGRLQTKVLLLDQMIIAADREIVRLQGVLSRLGVATSNPTSAARHPDLLPLHRNDPDPVDAARGNRPAAESPRGMSTLAQAILALAAQGLPVEKIAEATAQPLPRVMALIETARAFDRRDAA